MAGRKMHQTTVRFGPDLWDELELEARQAGVSVAQYVRDAALMRVAYTRGREGDRHYDAALESVTPQGGTELEVARARANDIRARETAGQRSQRGDDARAAQRTRAQASQGRRETRGGGEGAGGEIAAGWDGSDAAPDAF